MAWKGGLPVGDREAILRVSALLPAVFAELLRELVRLPELRYVPARGKRSTVCPETYPKRLANGPCGGTDGNLCQFRHRETNTAASTPSPGTPTTWSSSKSLAE